MKKLYILATVFALSATTLFAQQALLDNRSGIVSPEIKDNVVTFSVLVPDASDVRIIGEWIPSNNETKGSAAMTKDERGVWTYTTDNLPSDLYSYTITIDGIQNIDMNNVYVDRDVASLANIVIIGGGKGDNYKVNKVPHGTVSKRWYASPNNKYAQERRMTVYTPPGYEEDTNQKYPVLYLLHGMGGDEESWNTLGRTSQILDNLIAQGKVEPMIVVMPNGNVIQEAAPGESAVGMYKPVMLLPHSMDGEFEQTFPDIVNFVDKNYRTKNNKSGRAIAGLSMGGFHSLHISRLYPDMFEYVGMFSPAINPIDSTSNNVYADIDQTLITQKADGVRVYWIGIGKDDFLYDDVKAYRHKLSQLNIPYQYNETEGGHTWTNWRTYLQDFTPLLFKNDVQ